MPFIAFQAWALRDLPCSGACGASSSATAPRSCLRGCDLVLGGNSTVLLDALVAGTPACYVRGLDHGPHDVQDFVRDGLVYEPRAAPAGVNRRRRNRAVLPASRMAGDPAALCRRRRQPGGRRACRSIRTVRGRFHRSERRVNIIAVIPARMGSSRFPGKPLARPRRCSSRTASSRSGARFSRRSRHWLRRRSSRPSRSTCCGLSSTDTWFAWRKPHMRPAASVPPRISPTSLA